MFSNCFSKMVFFNMMRLGTLLSAQPQMDGWMDVTLTYWDT